MNHKGSERDAQGLSLLNGKAWTQPPSPAPTACKYPTPLSTCDASGSGQAELVPRCPDLVIAPICFPCGQAILVKHIPNHHPTAMMTLGKPLILFRPVPHLQFSMMIL